MNWRYKNELGLNRTQAMSDIGVMRRKTRLEWEQRRKHTRLEEWWWKGEPREIRNRRRERLERGIGRGAEEDNRGNGELCLPIIPQVWAPSTDRPLTLSTHHLTCLRVHKQTLIYTKFPLHTTPARQTAPPLRQSRRCFLPTTLGSRGTPHLTLMWPKLTSHLNWTPL